MKINASILRTILLAGLMLSANPVFSQDKFEIFGGFGFIDMETIGLRYGNNFQVGLTQSFGVRYSILQLPPQTAVEIYCHFGGKSEFTEQHPWYMLGRLGCFPLGYFCPRLGRSFFFSGRTGINIDLGIILPIGDSLKSEYYTILPSGRISFFYRF